MKVLLSALSVSALVLATLLWADHRAPVEGPRVRTLESGDWRPMPCPSVHARAFRTVEGGD